MSLLSILRVLLEFYQLLVNFKHLLGRCLKRAATLLKIAATFCCLMTYHLTLFVLGQRCLVIALQLMIGSRITVSWILAALAVQIF